MKKHEIFIYDTERRRVRLLELGDGLSDLRLLIGDAVVDLRQSYGSKGESTESLIKKYAMCKDHVANMDMRREKGRVMDQTDIAMYLYWLIHGRAIADVINERRSGDDAENS